MPYSAPATVVAGQTYNATAHNTIVNDIIDHESRIQAFEPATASAWTSYTLGFSNFSLGNGTVNSSVYTRIGKTVIVKIRVTLGSTSNATATLGITLPIAPAANYAGTPSVTFLSGGSYYYDTSAPAIAVLDVALSSGSIARLYAHTVLGGAGAFIGWTNVGPAAPAPITTGNATNDVLVLNFLYEGV